MKVLATRSVQYHPSNAYKHLIHLSPVFSVSIVSVNQLCYIGQLLCARATSY